MIPEEHDLCPYCLKHGLRNQVQTYQINWRSAMILCPNPECIFPLDQQLSLIESDGRKRAEGERSYDEGAFRKTLNCLRSDRGFRADLDNDVHVEGSSDSSREMTDYQLPEGIGTELMDDSGLDAYLAGDEQSGDFDDFLNYLSNLPNTAFSSFTEISNSNLIEIRRRQTEVMKVVNPPVLALNEVNLLSRLYAGIYQQDGKFSSDSLIHPPGSDSFMADSTEPRRYVQWSEQASRDRSWLVAGLCAVIHCRIVRCALKTILQTTLKTEQSPKSTVISLIFKDFQLAMRKLFVAMTLCNESTNKSKGFRDNFVNGFDPLRSPFDYLRFGADCPIHLPRSLHQRIVDHLSSCQRNVLKCFKSENIMANHPADLIGYLLDSHDSLRDLCVVSSRLHFVCSLCHYSSVEDRVTRTVTIECPASLPTFSLSGTECGVEHFCPSCGSVQIAQIEWLMVSPILFLHFPKGLPSNCEFEKLSLRTSALNISKENIGGIDRYCMTSRGGFELHVTTVITYDSENGDGGQYVTWVRRGKDSWMACKESLGQNSHLTEWDPMKAPSSTKQPAGSVRVLLLEGVPAPHEETPPEVPKSRLHERVIDVMRARKRQMMQQSYMTESENQKADTLGSRKTPTVMLQRFLNSDVEQRLLVGGKNYRFEPYPSDIRSGRAVKSEEGSSRRSESDASSDKCSTIVKTESVMVHSKSSSCLQNRMKKGKRSLNELEAMTLWPITTKALFSKSLGVPPTQGVKEESRRSSSTNSQSPVEPVTFSLDATTSFLEGHSAKLGWKQELNSESST